MPRRKRETAPTQDIAHPLNTEVRHQIEQMVLDAYQNAIEGGLLPELGEDPEDEV
jgi:DNA-binding cell septation regulator SpoVG